MRRSVGLLVALSFGSCKASTHASADAGAPVVATSSPTAVVATTGSTTIRDASTSIGVEQRKAYWAAILAGRKLTIAKKYPDAIEAFGRALAAIPDDGRALSERGYARFLAKDYAAAQTDFERALTSLGDGDAKLLAQVEFNLGLDLAARGNEDKAAAHFRRSYDLSPTAAAKARMGSCPATIDVPTTTTIFASEAAARAKLADLKPLDQPAGAYESDVGSGNGSSVVVVPIANGKLAALELSSGLLGSWHCGTLGEITIERDASAWKITYQAHRGGMETVCVCDGSSGACASPEYSGTAALPKCTCDEPACTPVCGGADLPEGSHEVAWIDATTGAGLAEIAFDHEYVDTLEIKSDVAAKSFSVTGLGCP